MKAAMPLLGSEKGMVLILSVFLIAALSLLGVAATRNTVTDIGASSNHLSSVQSFNLAEAGLQRGALEASMRLSVFDWYTFTPLLDGTSSKKVTFSFDTPVTFAGGNYQVTVANDPAENGSTTDHNRSMTVRSTAIMGASRSTVEAVIQMTTPPRLPAALAVIRDADIAADGGATFTCSGYDHTSAYVAGAPDGTASARLGIGLCDMSIDGVSESIIRTLVKGIGDVNGSADVGKSDKLAGQTVDDYIDSLRPIAKNSVSCSDFNITYSETDLSIDCTKGKGILVVNGNLEFLENSNWTGLIIVKGGKFYLRGSNDIRGGVVIETWTDSTGKQRKGGITFGAKGGVSIYSSREAYDKISEALTGKPGKWRMLAWRRIR